jgi:hypothetical protein
MAAEDNDYPKVPPMKANAKLQMATLLLHGFIILQISEASFGFWRLLGGTFLLHIYSKI